MDITQLYMLLFSGTPKIPDAFYGQTIKFKS
jgi:hypothetical protein